MYNASPTAIPSYASVNYAPLTPLLSLQNDPNPAQHYVQDALKERLKHYLGLEKDVWREIYNVGQLIDLFVQGKQIVRKNPITGLYRALTPLNEDQDTVRAANAMQYYETNCITKDGQSNPDIAVRAAKFTDEARAAAKGGQAIVDHYAGRFYTPEYTQRDARLAFRWGTSISRVRYDPGAAGIIVYREIAEQRSLQIGDGGGYCGACQHEDGAQAFLTMPEPAADENPASTPPIKACPQCGSNAVTVDMPATAQTPSVVGVEPIQMGDFVCDLLPLPACKFDLSQTAENSSWFINQTSQDVHAIKSILGNIKIPTGDDEEIGLKILQQLATAGQAISGRSQFDGRRDGQQWQEKRTVTEFYMSPSDYGDIPIKGDERTLGGQPLVEGTLEKTFPDGLVSVWLNNSVLLGLYAENHRRIITSRPWFQRPMSGVGRGAGDMVEVQKRINVIDSQILAYWRSTATPALLYDDVLLEGDKPAYLGNPATSIDVSTAGLPDGKGLHDAVWQFAPAPIPGNFLDYSNTHLNNMMQIASHITTFSGGLPGVNNKTATGAQITDSNSNAIWLPMLELKGSAKKRQMETVLYLYPKRFPMKREFPLGGDYSQAQGVAIQGADLDTDLWLEVVKNSEQPRSPYIKRANLAEAMQAVGGVAGIVALKQQDPKMFEEISKWYDLDFAVGASNSEIVAQICDKRINQLSQAMEQKMLNPVLLMTPEQMPTPEGVTDPMMAQQMQAQIAQMLGAEQQQAIQAALIPPVSALEPAQPEKAQHLADWLDTDLGQEAPPILRAAVEQLIKLHFGNGQGQASAIALASGQVELAGQAPGMAAQHLTESASKEKEQTHAADMQDRKASADMAKEKAKPKGKTK